MWEVCGLAISWRLGLSDITKTVDTRVAFVAKKNATKLSAFGERQDVFTLANLVSLDVLDGVQQSSSAVATNKAIANRHHIIAPACTGDGWGALLAINFQRKTKKAVNADVTSRGGRYNA